MKNYLILFTCGLLTTTSAQALTCKTPTGSNANCSSAVAAAGDCEMLGFAKETTADCTHYLYCPFNSSYKKCVTSSKSGVDCSDYPYTSCPAEAASCSTCDNGDQIFYKPDSCKTGYWLSENECHKLQTCEDFGYLTTDPASAFGSCWFCPSLSVTTDDSRKLNCYKDEGCYIDPECQASSCPDYTLTSCPETAASCLECQKLYKIEACKPGYELKNDQCISTERCEDHGYLSKDPTNLNNLCESCVSIDITANDGSPMRCYTGECSNDASCCKTEYPAVDACGASCKICDCRTITVTEETCKGYTYQDCTCASW